MGDSEKVEIGRDRLESGIELLAENGWTETDIREEVDNTIEALKADGVL